MVTFRRIWSRQCRWQIFSLGIAVVLCWACWLQYRELVFWRARDRSLDIAVNAPDGDGPAFVETERLTDTSSRIAISLPLQGVIHITPEIVTGASVDQRLGSQLRYDTQGQKLRLQLIFDLYYRPDVVEWRAEWRDCDGRSIGRGEVTLGKACTDWCVVDIEACRPDGTSLVLAKAADDRLLRITFQASDQRRQTDVDGEATQPAGQE